MQVPIQGKVLKAVEEQTFRRLGDVRDHRVDVRLIAASNRDLRKLVEEDRFRSDLYYRIAAFPIEVPVLRERLEDIPLLARGVLVRIACELGRVEMELTPGAIAALKSHSWPGNLREMRNVLERATLLADGRLLDAGDLDLSAEGRTPNGTESSLTLEEIERLHIARASRRSAGTWREQPSGLGSSKLPLPEAEEIRRLPAALTTPPLFAYNVNFSA